MQFVPYGMSARSWFSRGISGVQILPSPTYSWSTAVSAPSLGESLQIPQLYSSRSQHIIQLLLVLPFCSFLNIFYHLCESPLHYNNFSLRYCRLWANRRSVQVVTRISYSELRGCREHIPCFESCSSPCRNTF